MIHSYVNFVGWRELSALSLKSNYFYCDTISLRWFLRRLGAEFDFRPGIWACNEVLDTERSLFLLLPRFVETDHPSIILPAFEVDEIPRLVSELLPSISNFATLVIGVSSPKQNILANGFLKAGYEGNIHCFGASVVPCLEGVEIKRNRSNLFFFFVRSPLRTVKKLSFTFWGLVCFLCLKRDRERFLLFFKLSR